MGRAAAVGQDQLQAGKAVQHTRHQHRADAECGVERILRNLGETELCGTRRGPHQNRVDQDRHAERFGLAPERIEGKLADIGILDIRGNDHAAGAEPGGALEFLGGGIGLDQRNGADPGETIEPARDDAGTQLIVSSVFSSFPVALLVQA